MGRRYRRQKSRDEIQRSDAVGENDPAAVLAEEIASRNPVLTVLMIYAFGGICGAESKPSQTRKNRKNKELSTNLQLVLDIIDT
jgi:hypothetical protein